MSFIPVHIILSSWFLVHFISTQLYFFCSFFFLIVHWRFLLWHGKSLQISYVLDTEDFFFRQGGKRRKVSAGRLSCLYQARVERFHRVLLSSLWWYMALMNQDVEQGLDHRFKSKFTLWVLVSLQRTSFLADSNRFLYSSIAWVIGPSTWAIGRMLWCYFTRKIQGFTSGVLSVESVLSSEHMSMAFGPFFCKYGFPP